MSLRYPCSVRPLQWKTWALTSGDQLRLPPPPHEAATQAEIAQLKDIAKQRDAGTLERVVWWNAGPPGYRWTSIAIPPGQASATLHSRIMALLSVAIYDATVAAWDSKYAYNRPRPTVFDPSLTAALPNPQSPSYPSEHAVVAGAASTVLAYLFPDKANDFKARAEEAAQVWVQAGLHYPETFTEETLEAFRRSDEREQATATPSIDANRNATRRGWQNGESPRAATLAPDCQSAKMTFKRWPQYPKRVGSPRVMQFALLRRPRSLNYWQARSRV